MDNLILNSPNVYAAAVSVVLLAVVTVCLSEWGLERVEQTLRKTSLFLLRRNLFRTPLSRDLIKINLLRIVTGVILFDRTLNVAYFSINGPDTIFMNFIVCLGLLLSLLFIFGLFTPLVSGLLLFFNIMIIDTALTMYTLGSDVLSMLLIVFTLTPAGTRLSFDSFILNRGSPAIVARIISFLYQIIGHPTLLRATISKLICLASYGLLCIYSALVHVDDSLWTTGEVLILVLNGSYFSPFYDFFRELFSTNYWAILFVQFSSTVMFVWYFGFIIFTIIGGIFRWFIIIWAFLFYVISTFFLHLGWLGYYEFVLLAMLFWDKAFMNVGDTRMLEVYYDDRCNLCDRTVRFLRIMDVFCIAQLRPLSKYSESVERLGIPHEDALKNLYAYDMKSKKTIRGYTFYTELTKRIFLLTPLFPIFVVFRVLLIGPALYRLIAANRTKWFGVCSVPMNSQRTIVGNGIPIRSELNNRISRSIFSSFVLIHVSFAILFIATLPGTPFKPHLPITNAVAHIYGLIPINVFNAQDIKMNEHWHTFEAIHSDGSRSLVPLTGTEGERLAWHGSDRVLFSNSLLWRRRMNFEEEICFNKGYYFSKFRQEIYDWYNRRSDKKAVQFIIKYYQQDRFEVNPGGPPYLEIGDPVMTCIAGLDGKGRLVSLKRLEDGGT